MDLPVRIAQGQLAALSRLRRSVPAGPVIGLVREDADPPQAVLLAASPGVAAEASAVRAGLATVREAFAAVSRPVAVELVVEAGPELAALLIAEGATVTARMPVLAVEPDALRLPATPDGVTVHLIDAQSDYDLAGELAATAFGGSLSRTPMPSAPDLGGRILVRRDGVPAATASWTPVGAGVTEIVGVAVLPEHRRRGLGSLAAAHATRAAAELGRAELRWLTPADADAGRIYQRLGFRPVATAVHLDATTTG